jgi:hypothetical protein
MPVHWIDEEHDTLWFPPKDMSEAASQSVNHASWRKYTIRKIYWDTKTTDKRKGI